MFSKKYTPLFTYPFLVNYNMYIKFLFITPLWYWMRSFLYLSNKFTFINEKVQKMDKYIYTKKWKGIVTHFQNTIDLSCLYIKNRFLEKQISNISKYGSFINILIKKIKTGFILPWTCETNKQIPLRIFYILF